MMKKRILPIMACLCLTLAMIPGDAFAGSSDSYVEISGQRLESSGEAEYAVTDDSGAVSYENADETNYNIKYEDGVLYLRNANIAAQNTFGIVTSGDTTIVLDGENIVKGDIKGSAGLLESFGVISNGGILTIKDGEASGTGRLTVSGASYNDGIDGSADTSIGIYIARSSSDDSCGLKVESGIVKASGGEAVRSSDEDDTYSYGIISLGEISVTGGTLEAYSSTANTSTAIHASYNIDISGGHVSATSLSKALSSEDSGAAVFSGGICSSYGDITISGDNTIVAASGNEAVNESIGIYTETGSVVINGGTVRANQSEETYGYTTGDNSISSGICAAGDLIINGGNIEASGYASYESYGINSANGDIIISSNVYASGGRSVNTGGSAGIAASNGDITINNGYVYATTSLNGGATGSGISAKGNIFIYGGEIMAAPESNSIDGVEPGYSRGIFSDGGDVTISGEDTDVYALGGAAREMCAGIETSGGDIIIQCGTVNALGFNSYGGENLGMNAVAENEKGGNIIIESGSVQALGRTSGVNYSGDLTASPQQGKKITVKTLETVGEEDVPEYMPEYTPEEMIGMMLEKLFKKAQEIDGSPFVKETAVNKDSVSDMQYFAGITESNSGGDEGASSADDSIKNDPVPETGDSNEPLIWIACMLASAAAAVFIAVSGMRRMKQ